MSVMIRVLSNVQHQVYNSSGGNHYFFFIKKACHNVYITMTFPLRAEVKKWGYWASSNNYEKYYITSNLYRNNSILHPTLGFWGVLGKAVRMLLSR